MPAHALSYVPEEPPRESRDRGAAAGEQGMAAGDASRRNGCPVQLVRKAQRGNRRAFDALWRRYAPTVQGILLTMVADDEAEDLTQDVAVSAYKSIASLEKHESFPAWLCAIARNTGRDALAARRRSREAPLEEAESQHLAAPPNGDPTAADEILSEIRKLPECHREPLMLRLLLEMSGREIARETGMTEGSVRVNLCKGMSLLRQRLKHWE